MKTLLSLFLSSILALPAHAGQLSGDQTFSGDVRTTKLLDIQGELKWDRANISSPPTFQSSVTVNAALQAGTDVLYVEDGGQVGINQSAPTADLHVIGTVFVSTSTNSDSDALEITATETVLNEDGADRDFRVEGVGVTNALVVQGSDGSVGISTTAPNGALAVVGKAADSFSLHVSSPDFTPQLVVDRQGQVGIGNDAPGGVLDIVGPGGTVAGTPNSAYDDIIIRNDTNAGMTIFAGNDANTSVVFADEDAVQQGRVQYDHPNDTLEFRASATEIMVVDGPTLSVGIGINPPAATLHVQDGVILSSTTSGWGEFSAHGSSGGCIRLRVTDHATAYVQITALEDGTLVGVNNATGACQ